MTILLENLLFYIHDDDKCYITYKRLLIYNIFDFQKPLNLILKKNILWTFKKAIIKLFGNLKERKNINNEKLCNVCVIVDVILLNFFCNLVLFKKFLLID